MKTFLITTLTVLLISPSAVMAQTPDSGQGVDVVWESSSYTPQWYKGKALFSPGSILTFTAISHLRGPSGRIPPENIVYTWEVNHTVRGNLSGPGRQTLVLPTRLLDERFTIDLQASSPDGSISANRRVVVNRTSPEVVLYEESPLSGILSNRAVGRTFQMQSEETTFAAVPFFFTTSNPLALIDYSWRLNNSSINADQNKATFRSSGEGGRARISVSAEHRNNVLQSGRKVFDIIFENEDDF